MRAPDCHYHSEPCAHCGPNRKVVVTPERTCEFCRHFSAVAGAAVGNCALGGPTPEEGCSDVRYDETCEKWAEVAE